MISSEIHCENKIPFLNKNGYFPKIQLAMPIFFSNKQYTFLKSPWTYIVLFFHSFINCRNCLRISQLLENYWWMIITYVLHTRQVDWSCMLTQFWGCFWMLNTLDDGHKWHPRMLNTYTMDGCFWMLNSFCLVCST